MKFRVPKREKNRLKRESKRKQLRQANRSYSISRRRLRKEEYLDRKADRRKHREDAEKIMDQINQDPI